MQCFEIVVGVVVIEKQYYKKCMIVWECIWVFIDKDFIVLYQNWGKNLDGVLIVIVIVNIDGCDVVLYGYDFIVCVGFMDVINGCKLVSLIKLVGECGIFFIGMNDFVGVYVFVGVGGLDGYVEVFVVLCRISGVVFSIMCMFGYNVGGGVYFFC